MKRKFLSILCLFLWLSFPCFGKETGFTQQDRERLIALEKRLIKIETTLVMFMKHVEKRFEAIDKRFEDINKRFEDINKRFEDINKRFEDVNRRFDQMINFLWMIVGIFTTLTAVVIGFAYWDRRTIIKRAKEEVLTEIEKEGRVQDLIRALKKLALEDRKLAEVLKEYGIMPG